MFKVEMDFTNVEVADIQLVFGMTVCNCALSRRLYSKCFPNERLTREKFVNMHADRKSVV